MIGDVDETLCALVRDGVPVGAEVDVVLEAPTREWAARRSGPTVNLYLYDIREDLKRRQGGTADTFDGSGRLIARRPPDRWFKLSYLVTAWTTRAQDEHRLLAALLACFLRHDQLPRRLLAGTLAESSASMPLTVGLPPPEDRSFADVWSALGGELKPSLDLVVSAPMTAGVPWPAGEPVTQPPVLVAAGLDPWPNRERRTVRAHPPASPPTQDAAPAEPPRRPRRARGRLADG